MLHFHRRPDEWQLLSVKSPFDIAEMLILKTNKKFPLIQGVGIQRTPNTVPTTAEHVRSHT
jgi:hypothetical protein